MTAMRGKGGPWTERKLKAVGGYLEAFNSALKDKPTPTHPFTRIYIDAFAGSGDRELPKMPLFDNDADIAQFAKGSVRIALDCEPSFDQLHFVELNSKHLTDLEALAKEYPDRRVTIHAGDANEWVVKICQHWDKRMCRGVLFIDPYGCQVEWSTLLAVAQTQRIDVWLLFPVNAVRRMMPRNANFQHGWRDRLTSLFGTEEWFDFFYSQNKNENDDLFGHAGVALGREVTLERIEEFYRDRLGTIFCGGVSQKALGLGPKSREPLYSLFFACGNPSETARKLAFKIANHLIRKWNG